MKNSAERRSRQSPISDTRYDEDDDDVMTAA
jgi:hypothetical protein